MAQLITQNDRRCANNSINQLKLANVCVTTLKIDYVNDFVKKCPFERHLFTSILFVRLFFCTKEFEWQWNYDNYIMFHSSPHLMTYTVD